MRELTDIEAAYIAGLIDGEGCLAIIRQKNSNCRGGYAYRCGLRFANSNQAIVEWLAEKVGTGCVKAHQPKMRNSKCQRCWDIWGDDAAALTQRLLPYLRIRRPQADLLLSFQAALKRREGPTLTDQELAFREACYHQSRSLNQRGLVEYGGGGHKNAAGFTLPHGAAP